MLYFASVHLICLRSYIFSSHKFYFFPWNSSDSLIYISMSRNPTNCIGFHRFHIIVLNISLQYFSKHLTKKVLLLYNYIMIIMTKKINSDYSNTVLIYISWIVPKMPSVDFLKIFFAFDCYLILVSFNLKVSLTTNLLKKAEHLSSIHILDLSDFPRHVI